MPESVGTGAADGNEDGSLINARALKRLATDTYVPSIDGTDEIVARAEPQIAVTIIGPTEDEALRDMDLAIQQGADIIEIRRDFFEKLNLERIAKHNDKTKIFTCRHRNEAGSDPRAGFKGSAGCPYSIDEQRLELYLEAAKLKFDYLDIEHKHPLGHKHGTLAEGIKTNSCGKSKIILSYHDFNFTTIWPELMNIFTRIQNSKPDVVKIATMAKTYEDNTNMLRLSDWANNNYPKQERVLMTMGPLCGETRVYGPQHGVEWVYACLDGKPAAPGQMSIGQAKRIWKELGIE